MLLKEYLKFSTHIYIVYEFMYSVDEEEPTCLLHTLLFQKKDLKVNSVSSQSPLIRMCTCFLFPFCVVFFLLSFLSFQARVALYFSVGLPFLIMINWIFMKILCLAFKYVEKKKIKKTNTIVQVSGQMLF